MIALLAQCAYLSETSRMIELHRALTARGATVRMATHGGAHQNQLTAAGIPFEVLGPPMSDARGARFVADAPGLGSVRQSMYTDAELRSYVMAEASWLSRISARVAVTGFLLTAQLSTRLAGIPLVTTHTGSWVPPVWERGLLPADPPWPAMRLLPEPVRRRLINAAPHRVRFHTAGFNRVARELGVEPVPSLAALVLGDLTLVTEVPEVLGIPEKIVEDWRAHGRRGYRPGTRLAYSGPLYARLDAPVPPHVEDFLNGPGPIVYVALTSSSPALVRQVTAAASRVARVLVAGTVHAVGDLHSGRTCVAGVLPSHLVMPRVDLAITTAGQGSVQTAMATGTPLLAVPLQPEQTLNAVLVEKLGAARRLPTAAAAAGLVRAMLDDDGYRLAAKRIQGWYDAVDGAGRAADRILAAAGA